MACAEEVHCKTFRCKFTVKYWQLGCQPHTVFLQDYYCKQHLQFCTVFTKYSIILLYFFFTVLDCIIYREYCNSCFSICTIRFTKLKILYFFITVVTKKEKTTFSEF